MRDVCFEFDYIIDNCSPNDRASCHPNAECVYGQAEGAYVCKCIEGITYNGTP